MFVSQNEFSIYIEKLKEQEHLETIMETLIYYAENQSDQEYEQIVKMLNRKLRDKIEMEARDMRMLKDNTELVSLF